MEIKIYIYILILLSSIIYIFKRNSIMIIILLYVMISVYLLYIRKTVSCEYTKYPLCKSSNIPNVIYTYWHDTTLPELIKKSINSWKHHNPTYTVTIINKDTLHKYMDPSIIPKTYSHQLTSDLIRLYILEKYGGMWLDASIYLNQSLDWVHSYQQKENTEFVGYRIKLFETTHIPVVESWFLCAVPNSVFIKDWKNKLFEVLSYNSPVEYVDELMKKTDIQNISSPYYLMIHVACQYILQYNTKKYKISLLDAEEGPLRFRASPWYHLFLPIMSYNEDKTAPLVKNRGIERKILEILESVGF
jgi:hypothetical protein